MKNALIVGGVFCATLLGFYLLQQSNAIAQPPITTRVVNASPQGEWVALYAVPYSQGYSGSHEGQEKTGESWSKYVILYHTGTGKVRRVSWPSFANKPTMTVSETTY